ncbi:heptaprenyl diphosphate synthase [Actinoplanes campanulatus]|uniref:Heptaprenyl diphosphate synthase n=2 Tax=Actinoplanes TaxID=1865 RepID=A0A7W5APZ1_9ACTN|nr:heptaprenyl diphosphate synthase [Actinoplanes campanulatus]GGN47329.1 geranylgeranyl pyrophosphate synthase [Actinoplanes campanulatus]GID40384.1 geranylgeranyl pyrophosphate synthase [Actinoplanes campanulatus]
MVSTGDPTPRETALSSLGLDVDPAMDESVSATLAAVEEALRVHVTSADPLVAEAARHLADAGGKRFRPLLVALGAQFGDPASPEVVAAANVVELTHLATLYHDDVMDEAAVRRGASSANARWGNSVAILVGDYLFAQAADLAASLGTEAVHLQAQTFARLVHGQIAETVGPRGTDPIEHHLFVITEKTASLIATAARFGGLFSGARPEHVEALAGYGHAIGIAFQLSDDLLDIASESVQSGKTPGTDLREGIPTLPVLYALAGDDTDASAVRLRELLAAGPITDDTLHAEALSLLRESAAMKRARETVRSYAEEARTQLAPLPDGAPKRAMESLCDFIADRTG